MKKTLLSMMLVISMILSMGIISNAADTTLKDVVTKEVENYKGDVSVDTDMMVRLNGGEYANGPAEFTYSSTYPNADFQATMFTKKIRDTFTTLTGNAEKAIATKPNSAALSRELDEVRIKGEFTITVKYPTSLAVSNNITNDTKQMVGFNDNAKVLFVEKSRNTADKDGTTTMTIVVGIKNEFITKKDLKDNLNTNLADNFVFEVANIGTADKGTYTAYGEISGYTEFYGATDKDNYGKINYKSVQKADGLNPHDPTGISATFTISKSGGGTGGTTGSGGFVPGANEIVVKADKPSSTVKAGEKITLTSNVAKSKIYYTTDGSEPQLDEKGNPMGTTKEYTAPLEITQDTVVKMIAVSEDGKKKSKITELNYTVEGVDIAANPKGGVVSVGQKVELSSKKGEKIYYTTDGTEPAVDDKGVPTGTTKLYESPIEILKDTQIKAISIGKDGVKSTILDEKYTFSPVELNSEDHIAYIIGYPNGDVLPKGDITRAEVTTAFYRLLTKEKRDALLTDANDFSDVNAGDWFEKAVSSMAKGEYVTGYEDGTFLPNKPITRAEFVTIASRFTSLVENADIAFTDVTGHWAEKYIGTAVSKGWVTGYPDNTFKPAQNITRAEAMAIINRMLNRKVAKEGLLDSAKYWPDNKEGEWYYYDVMEATNAHKYERATVTENEKWTEILKNNVLTELDKYEN